MMFLISVTVMLISVLVTTAVHVNLYEESIIDTDNILIVMPNEFYTRELFLMAAIINLISSGFFVLPVL